MEVKYLNLRDFGLCFWELQWWMFRATFVECFFFSRPPQCPGKATKIPTLKTLLLYLFPSLLSSRVKAKSRCLQSFLHGVQYFSKLGALQKLVYECASAGGVVHLLPPISVFPVFAVGERKVRMIRRPCAVEKGARLYNRRKFYPDNSNNNINYY